MEDPFSGPCVSEDQGAKYGALSSMQHRRPHSSVPSCVSMKSDWSNNDPISFGQGTFHDEESSMQHRRAPSPVPSCVSMKSDWSKVDPINFGQGTFHDEERLQADQQSTRTDSTAQQTLGQRLTLEEQRVQFAHKKYLEVKCRCLIEGISQQGTPRVLNEIYTELYITKGETGEVNDEHEVRWIERKSWKDAPQGKPIKCNDIFKHSDERSKQIRTVLTKGVAGIGKTISVQKFILDWAEGKANEDIHFIFPIPFRVLNLMSQRNLSLMDLIHQLFTETRHLTATTLLGNDDHKVLFIFDGLDEYRLSLDFQNNKICHDVTEPTSVDVLLTNLIKGNLLPSALLWATSRPAASSQIPSECIDQLTEVRGFTGPQREEYFRKRISDENLAHRTITHLRSSRSLYIMCHIPVLCCLTATVLERMLSNVENGEAPRTLTQIYTRFLSIQIDIKKEKYTDKDKDDDMIFKLGKLAFEQLEKGNLIFYEADLKECGIDVTEASVYSGLCTQIFREELSLHYGKVFCFVHLSIQEYLAALYVLLCFGRNIPAKLQLSQFLALFQAPTFFDLHKATVDLAMQNENGHLDLFLRFLLGLSLDSNRALLQNFLPETWGQYHKSDQTVQYIKQQIRKNPSALLENSKYSRSSSVRMINLFYSLNELNHHAVVEFIDKASGSGTVSVVMLLSGEWNTRKFVFKVSEEELEDFDLQKYIKSPEKDLTEFLSPDEVLQRLLPLVTASMSADLVNSKLSEKSCASLASALSSESSDLKELKLNGNELKDSGLKVLCSALSHQNCKLVKLELIGCKLSERSCSYMASALTSSSSSLRELNLSGNDLLDSGVKHLCTALCNPNCKLETLWLFNSKLTQDSCACLASALSSNSSSLTVLNLRYNKLRASDVELLSALEKNPNCKLKTLRWKY
ncbi:protein NLRC3-like isoform X1 [Alosa pseudoharengus]|uniref:protein NLRC3-like isoform X1 n=1 Tax=Alosa pseudoharengus TaxID=34774 RepID=UPI003F8A678C